MIEYGLRGVRHTSSSLVRPKNLRILVARLGTQALRVDDVGQAGNVGLALLDDAEGQDGQVHGDDAATDRLSLALAGAAGAVAGVAVGEQEADTAGVHDTLLHGETLLVVAAGDAEDVALELVADGVTSNFGAHLKLVLAICSWVPFKKYCDSVSSTGLLMCFLPS